MAGDMYESLAADLRQLAGDANVVAGPRGRTLLVRPGPPAPGRPPAELAAVLRLAARYGVVISSAGYPPEGVYLRLDRWNRVVAVDRQGLCLAVQPEAAAGRVLDTLAGEGLDLPPDPCLKPAVRAGRDSIGAYAATRRLLGLEAVLPDGSAVRLGGPGGADQLETGLARLIMGSGGTMGVVTCLYLQMGYRSPASALMLAGFARVEEARAVFFALAERPELAGIRLECLDFGLPSGAPDFLGPYAGHQGVLVLEFSGPGPEVVEEAFVRAGLFCREAGAIEVLVADNQATRQRVKKIREHYLAWAEHGGPLVFVHGPVRSEWPDQALAAGLTVPYCRLEGGTLGLGIGPAGDLRGFLAGREASARDGGVSAILARIAGVIDPGAVFRDII